MYQKALLIIQRPPDLVVSEFGLRQIDSGQSLVLPFGQPIQLRMSLTRLMMLVLLVSQLTLAR
jgi:hypothetical protein